MKWLEDKPSQEFRDRVLCMADAELAKQAVTGGYRVWLMRLAGAAILAVCGLVLSRPRPEEKHAFDLGENDPAMLEELALLEDLEFWRNLETIESLNHKDA